MTGPDGSQRMKNGDPCDREECRDGPDRFGNPTGVVYWDLVWKGWVCTKCDTRRQVSEKATALFVKCAECDGYLKPHQGHICPMQKVKANRRADNF